jgi:hypothetical protein
MRMKKPRIASIDEVRITREGEAATIENADPSVSAMHLTVGPALGSMTDAEILALFNDVVAARQSLADSYDAPCVEIPPGKPQILYSARCDQWVPRGDILRCHIDDSEIGQLVVHVDDQELSLHEFGRLLKTFAGWGMRIAFVPEDRTDIEPEIVVREPDDRDDPDV